MSLTAAILFRHPAPVFRDAKPSHKASPWGNASHDALRDKNAALRQQNIDAVMAAVKEAGGNMTTVAAIQTSTGIGRITVCKALRELEDCNKVVRVRRAHQTFFKAKS